MPLDSVGAQASGNAIGDFIDTYLKAKQMKQQNDYQKQMMQLQGLEHGVTFDQAGGIAKTDEQKQKENIDRLGKIGDLQAKGLIPKYDEGGGLIGFEADPNSNSMLDKKNDRILKDLQIRKTQKDLAETSKGAKLPAAQAEQLGAANASFEALNSANKQFQDNQDIVGPGQGLLSKAAGYLQVGDRGKKSAAFDAQLKINAQTVGKYLEGGKLTDADIDRYKAMLPTLTDSPQVAAAKTETLQRLIAQKQASEKKAFGQSGYNVADIETSEAPPIGNSLIQPKQQAGGLVPSGLISTPSAEAASAKPKMIMQNGHKYILNDKTGEYE